ncbi:MAG: hypothetical protein VYC58_04365 [Pseudomonadota bacterium]|nr:hypothetical protein [Pseudomonadota bacterium]
MTAISVILAKPDVGKEEQAKERMKHRAKIMSNNGFTTRVAEGFSGPTAGHLAVQAMTEDWTAMGTALTKMAADPEFIEWQQNRRKNPIGHMVRRTGLRTVYGEPQWAEFPVSYYRRYKMPRSNLKKAIELIAEIDSIETMKDDWTISAAVPITGAEMDMFLAAYQFKSLEVMGQCLDEIGTSEQMQDIVTRASELGNILTADVAITVA